MTPATVDLRSLAGTFLAGLPNDVAESLLAGSELCSVIAGQVLFPAIDPESRVGVVLEGTARSYLTGADGRQLTIRYARRGAIIGKRSEVSGDHTPLTVQAVSDCLILELRSDVLGRLVRSDAAVASAMVSELSRRLEDVYATVADSAFGSMRQRVVRHLLAMGGDNGEAGRHVVPVTQQQLADGIGTSREVVGRVLSILRREGLLRTRPREIEILDLTRLAAFLGEGRTGSRPARLPRQHSSSRSST
jgi:CRP/FNR family transcriptional regulator, cyclic AMP receptor protein